MRTYSSAANHSDHYIHDR